MSADRLAAYGGRLVTTDGRPTVELVDSNDNARRVFQYRRAGAGLERRMLAAGEPSANGSPWEPVADLGAIRAARGAYHPILDPLGL